ncbi:MAG: hypothetical protein E7652_04680 [Ruminococcaceae bacterium]|nr:hypothetical protein [Oscillospiraceae bacterium]
MTELFDIQRFADEAEEKTTGEEIPFDAEKEIKSSEKVSFDELIRGDYREEYTKRVEDIIKKRLRDHAALTKDMNAVRSALTEAGESIGLDTTDPGEIIAALRDKIASHTDTADARGAIPTEEGGKSERIEALKSDLLKLVRDADGIREIYPEFELARELKDPRFREMLRFTRNDLIKSFEMLHHDEIVESAVKDAARLAEERLAGSIASKAHRPSEGAQTAISSIHIDHTPGSLTKAERADIKRRVRRGERITW